MQPQRRVLVDLRFEQLELAGDELGGLVALVDPSGADHHGVLDQQVTDLGHGLGEHHHLDRALQVLEDEHGHQVALLGPLALQAGDHPADRALGAVVQVAELEDRAVDLALEGLLGAEQRVVRHVEAEHLLLEREPVLLVELDVGDADPLVERGALLHLAEERHDAHVVLLATGDGRVDDLLEHGEQSLAGVAHRVEPARLDQRFDGALVEHLGVDPLAEVVEVLEGAVLVPLVDDELDQPGADVADRGQAEEDPVRSPVDRCAVAVGFGHHRSEVRQRTVDVGDGDLDAHGPALGQVHRGLVEVGLDAGQKRREVLGRVVRLEEGGLVGDVAVAVAVALVERVVGEGLDDVEPGGAQLGAVAGGLATLDELGALLGDELAHLLPTRLPEVVGVGQGVPREALGDPHDPFLVDAQPVGVAEDLLGVGVQVGDLLPAVLAVRVVGVHVRRHRTGPVQGDEGGDVLELGRRQRPDEGPHGATLQLEHADRVGPTQQFVGGFVGQVDVVDVDLDATGAPDQLERVGDDVEVAQAQEVHLEQAELLDAVHLVLGDDRRLFDRHAGLGLALDRQVLGQRLLGDHHRGGVDAVLASQPLEPLGDVDDLPGLGVGRVHLAQLDGHLVAVDELGVLLQAGVQRGVAAHHQRRHGLGDLVAHDVGLAEHPRRVAHRGPGLDRREGDDLSDVVTSVALRGVADHLVAVAGVEVHVDVGHGDATGVEEPLEQQVVLDGIEVGDPQRVGDRAPRRGPTAGADADVRVAGVADQVPHDQEVRAEPHVADDLELVGEAFDHVVGQLVAPALAGALEGEVLEVLGVVGEALGQREVGQLRLAELDLDVAALGDPQRVVAGLGRLAEQVTHLCRGLQVVLVAVELEAVRVAHQRAGLHAQERIVGHGVVAVHVVAVVGGEQRRLDPSGDLEQLRVCAVLLGDAVVLDLDEEVVATEDVLEAGGLGQRRVEALVHERLQHVAAEAAGGGDDALVVLGERVPVDPGLVVVALHVGAAGQLDDVPVADVVLGQQRQVVVELAATLDVAAGVVDLAPSGRPLEAGVVGHVGLGADDRRDPRVTAGLVEVEDPVHVAVVGDPHGRLAVRDRRGDDVADARRAVEHRVLGVLVQVDEAVRHLSLPVRGGHPRPSVHRIRGRQRPETTLV